MTKPKRNNSSMLLVTMLWLVAVLLINCLTGFGKEELVVQSSPLPRAKIACLTDLAGAGEAAENRGAATKNGLTSFRSFSFDANAVDLRVSDLKQIGDIADSMRRRPSLKVGIEATSPRDSDARKQELDGRRVSALRYALMDAGVPASRIQMGWFGEAGDPRIEMILLSVIDR